MVVHNLLPTAPLQQNLSTVTLQVQDKEPVADGVVSSPSRIPRAHGYRTGRPARTSTSSCRAE